MKDPEAYRQEILNKVKQDPISLDTDKDMWEDVLGRISEKEIKRKHYYLWYASAAAILLILVSAGIFFANKTSPADSPTAVAAPKVSSGNKNVVKFPSAAEEKISGRDQSAAKNVPSAIPTAASEAAGKMRIVSGSKVAVHKLADGSEITLNSNAEVNIAEASARTVIAELSGEAYFDVRPDKKRAFKVNFGESYLIVVGTKFNVRNIEGEAGQEVVVEEGIVRVYPKGSDNAIEVKSGEVLTIGSGKGGVHTSKIDPHPYIAWKTGILSFKNTPFDEVATTLQRYYKIKVVADNDISGCTFTADLSKTPLEDALQIIEATTSLKIKRTKENVYISGSPCN